MKRREFLGTAALGAAAVSLQAHRLAEGQAKGVTPPVTVFTKCLQFLDYDELGAVLAETGFDGADMPVRPGGQVLPERAGTDLKKAVAALQRSGIGLPMITTSISDPSDPLTEKVLAAASGNGVKYYRMGWLAYDDKKTIPQNLDVLKTTFEKLERINRKYKIRGEYQNHSGLRVGGPVWDLYHLLKDLDPEYIGVQYDVRHATAEGGVCWPLGMKLVSPWIGTTDIKDFHWYRDDNGRWRIRNVPLGEGMVDFGTYFREFVKLNISHPVSIHYEYDLGGAESGASTTTMPLAEIRQWLRKDLSYVKEIFRQHGI